MVIPLVPVGEDTSLFQHFLSVSACEHNRKLFVSKYNWPQQELVASLRQKSKEYNKKTEQKDVAIKIDNFLSVGFFFFLNPIAVGGGIWQWKKV